MNTHLIISSFILWMFCTALKVTGQTSTVQDRDGNAYTFKTMPDNKCWMTVNLNIKIPQSYCYNNDEQNCKQYGRLYTWESAQEACKLLGEGWRLPSNAEWQQLGKRYGGVRDDSEDGGKSAYQALITGGASGFNVLYGGGRSDGDSTYARLDAHGFYWTASETDSTHAVFYNFGKNGKIMNRHVDGEKLRAFSVRCVRDIR